MSNKKVVLSVLFLMLVAALPAAAAKPEYRPPLDLERTAAFVENAQQQETLGRRVFRDLLKRKEQQLRQRVTATTPTAPALSDTLSDSILTMGNDYYRNTFFCMAEILVLYRLMCHVYGMENSDELKDIKEYGEYYEQHHPDIVLKELQNLWPKILPEGSTYLLPDVQSESYSFLQTYLIMWALWEREQGASN